MITKYEKYTDLQALQNKEENDRVAAEYLGTFVGGLLCFEGYWDFNVYGRRSCKPFVENLPALTGEFIRCGYRNFETKDQLKYYLKWPEGLVWQNPQTWGTSVFYVSCHGSNKGFDLPMGLITKDDLIDIFNEGFSNFPNVLYFSACSLFEDDAFGHKLLEVSGSRGIFGFKKEVGYTMGLLIDLVFLATFYMFKDDDPFQYLQQIYDSVIDTIPIAKDFGFTLFV
ncbi:MAG: hypothetical protein ABSD71_14895 [Bacteroidales bacterium]|jgi:hypothetical protein